MKLPRELFQIAARKALMVSSSRMNSLTGLRLSADVYLCCAGFRGRNDGLFNFSIEEPIPTGSSAPGGKTSTISPRTAYSPASHRISTVIGIGGEKSCQIGRADLVTRLERQHRCSKQLLGGVRCNQALIVVSTICPSAWVASSARQCRRLPVSTPPGEMRS